MPVDGISRLITITQMKSSNANDDAMSGAAMQKKSIENQKNIRTSQRAIEQQTWSELEPAASELRLRLPAFRRTLSPAAAALLDKWMEWASQHR